LPTGSPERVSENPRFAPGSHVAFPFPFGEARNTPGAASASRRPPDSHLSMQTMEPGHPDQLPALVRFAPGGAA